MWKIQVRVKTEYADRFPACGEWSDCDGAGWASFDGANEHLQDLRAVEMVFEYRAVFRGSRPVEVVQPMAPLVASGLCQNDQDVVLLSLSRLMEDYSERIRRNALWAEDGRADAERYEASRALFASDYLAAVRSAGMC